jgi:hypothetical protein
VQISFEQHATRDWQAAARAVFLTEYSPATMRLAIKDAAYNLGFFAGHAQADCVGIVVY